MEFDELDNKLTAWWLEIAPSRQRELLMVPSPPMPWLDESIAEAGLNAADVHRFLDDRRRELEPTRDAGLNPKADGGAGISVVTGRGDTRS
jgi:hypothetical protein